MALRIDTLAGFRDTGFDTVIDVRSPAEYAEDHLPGAISLPVLDDAERARVGTIYTRRSPFLARKIGAALVARNAARHIETALMQQGGGWRPLVYCWRGGQRSGAFAAILGQIGWRVEVLAGGYRSYRRLVARAMHDAPLAHKLVLIDGNTGTAKTALLARLAARGVQVVDLEALAGHRGSILGATAGGQPAQKRFEASLAHAFDGLDPARPVVAEAESSRIGERQLPPAVWAAMRAAPRIEIAAPIGARARYLVEAYADLAADPARLDARLAALAPLQGAAHVEAWRALAAEGRHEDLAARLMAEHYDPRYARSRARDARPPLTRIALDALAPRDIDAAAARVAALLADARPAAAE